MKTNKKLTIPTLIKFGSKENLEKFRKGQVYLNSFDYFRDWNNFKNDGLSKEDHPVYDQYEGLINNVFGDYSWTDESGKIQNRKFTADVAKLNVNALCLYGIFERQIKVPFIDQRCKHFGDSFLFILDQGGFFKLLMSQLNGMLYDINRIKYIDDNFFDPFYKRTKYSYQKEIRLVVNNPEQTPLIFEVGNIENMTSKIFDTKHISGVRLNIDNKNRG